MIDLENGEKQIVCRGIINYGYLGKTIVVMLISV